MMSQTRARSPKCMLYAALCSRTFKYRGKCDDFTQPCCIVTQQHGESLLQTEWASPQAELADMKKAVKKAHAARGSSFWLTNTSYTSQADTYLTICMSSHLACEWSYRLMSAEVPVGSKRVRCISLLVQTRDVQDLGGPLCFAINGHIYDQREQNSHFAAMLHKDRPSPGLLYKPRQQFNHFDNLQDFITNMAACLLELEQDPDCPAGQQG